MNIQGFKRIECVWKGLKQQFCQDTQDHDVHKGSGDVLKKPKPKSHDVKKIGHKIQPAQPNTHQQILADELGRKLSVHGG